MFVPNAVGEWIHPDNASAETIAAIAQSCPSGAIAQVVLQLDSADAVKKYVARQLGNRV